MNNSLIASKVREQLSKFLGIFSPRFSKPTTGFIGEMLYGLQAFKDVKLSQIGRGLDEEIPLKETCERLSRNLAKEGLCEEMSEAIAMEGAKHVRKETVIAVDVTDIRKLYAKSMPYLATVRDGSEKELGPGYWGCAAVACESGGRKMVPLHMRLWSCEAPGFRSENDEIFEVIKTVSRGAGKRGIYAIDRGGDRGDIFDFLAERELDYVVRLVGDRNLLWGKRGKPVLAEKLARKCKMRHAETLIRETAKGEKTYHIEFGVMEVRLPWRKHEALRMVVIKGFGEKPMMLLTTLAATNSRKALWQVVEAYLTRWRVEDAIRFIKQSYKLEDIRLLNYTRLRNMMGIVLAAAYFTSAWLGKSLRREILAGNLVRLSKRLFGVPEFHSYALADGLSTVLRRSGKWLRKKLPVPDDPTQLPLRFSSA